VTGNIISVLLIVILVIVVLGGTFYLRTVFTRNDAKTLHELGLERPDFLQRMMKARDYKQYALEILVKRGIINMKEDGRVYMVEEKLDQELRAKRDELLFQGRS
jgi:hypothetical protein